MSIYQYITYSNKFGIKIYFFPLKRVYIFLADSVCMCVVHSMKWCGSGNGAEVSIEQLVQQILESQQTKPQPRTHTCLCNHGNTD